MRAQRRCCSLVILPSLLLLFVAMPAHADINVQCPAPLLTQAPDGAGGFLNFNPQNPGLSTDPGCQDASAPDFFETCRVQLDPVTGQPSGATTDPNVICRSITCGDGHVYMADRDRTASDPDLSDTYIFGFSDVTNVPEAQIMVRGNPGDSLHGAANFAAPTLFTREGQKLYLTLVNTGMRERPDLFDPHTVHYHGFPNAASVFDGEPMASMGINLGSSITYFYDNQNPGTYMYHCHVEAPEHMQMGMLGNLYILPAQDGESHAYGGDTYTKFAYNDCSSPPVVPGDPMCGSTGYDVPHFLQISGFDPVFHNADHSYNRFSFADMKDTYGLLNGRGYPDTIDPNPIVNVDGNPAQPVPAIPMEVDGSGNYAPVTIAAGQKVLLHLSSLATVDFSTFTVLGIPMRVVGQGAKLLRGPTGVNTSYATQSVTLGGGEGVDILLDTTGVAPGTYFLYTTNVHQLSNNAEDYGGMMTELVVQ
jgi:FtsP/CotA-like multicopper oxidase with cupredoxin domain